MGLLRTSRSSVACLLIALVVALSACTSEPETATTEPTIDSSVATITTETTVGPEVEPDPPVVVDRRASLRLLPGECYSDLTIDQPRQDPLLPESPWVDVVDCEGTHFAKVYAVGCMGISPDSGELGAAPCPGYLDDVWPGKVELQRAAVKACLEQFEAVHGESYAETEKRAVELMPVETTWLVGERTVVCAARG